MGCISSKKEVEDVYPTIFQVTNVDEHGNRVHPGQLEITDVDLILYQYGKPPIRWPLKTLRRYGFDSEHFSFESGRRCPTGPGIYAFRCRRAEQLFNLLQNRIQGRNTGEGGEPAENASNRDAGYLEPNSVRRITPSARIPSHNGVVRANPTPSSSGTLGALSSHSSNSQSSSLDSTSFVNSTSRPLSQKLYANDEVIASVAQGMGETNNNKAGDEPLPPQILCHDDKNTDDDLDTSVPNDLNIDEEIVPALVNNGHLYMNIIPGTGDVIPFVPHVSHAVVTSEPVGLVQSYANFVTESLINKRSPPQPPTKKLNYIVLDLEPSSDITKPPNSSPPVTPLQSSPGYAAIDFRKTAALSHSVLPNFDNDSESSRKTRHNSSIEDRTSHSRHSMSISD